MRGRGGVDVARAGNLVRPSALVLDDCFVALDRGTVGSDPGVMIATIGKDDDLPVFQTLVNTGLGSCSPAPVPGNALVQGYKEPSGDRGLK